MRAHVWRVTGHSCKNILLQFGPKIVWWKKYAFPKKTAKRPNNLNSTSVGFCVFVFQPYPKIKNQCVVGIKFLLILNMSEHLFLETVGLLELFLRKPRFQAKTEVLQQFCVLTRHCGSSCCSMEQRHCVTY